MGPETQGSRVRGRRLPDGDTRKRPGKREPARGQKGATRRREPGPGTCNQEHTARARAQTRRFKTHRQAFGEGRGHRTSETQEGRGAKGTWQKHEDELRPRGRSYTEARACGPEPGWGVVSQDPWLRGFGAESRLHTFQVPTVPLPTERREAEHRRPSRAVAGKTQKRNFKERRRCQLDSLSPHRVCPGHTRPLLESGPKHSHLKLIKPLDPATHVQEPQAAEVCFK